METGDSDDQLEGDVAGDGDVRESRRPCHDVSHPQLTLYPNFLKKY